MIAITVQDEISALRARLVSTLEKTRGPLHKILFRSLRVLYPVVLTALPMFIASFGAWGAASVALIATIILIHRGFKPRVGAKQPLEMAAAIGFCAAIAFGLPTALYNFSTEPCVGFANDLTNGDVRSLSDPRLAEPERGWVERTTAYLAPYWPKHGVPPLEATAVANVVVHAGAVVQEISWRGTEPLTRLGLTEAKAAYAALHFDRRRVCHLYGMRDRAYGIDLTDRKSRRIVEETDRAMALILPALQATYNPPVSQSLATTDEPSEGLTKLSSTGIN